MQKIIREITGEDLKSLPLEIYHSVNDYKQTIVYMHNGRYAYLNTNNELYAMPQHQLKYMRVKEILPLTFSYIKEHCKMGETVFRAGIYLFPFVGFDSEGNVVIEDEMGKYDHRLEEEIKNWTICEGEDV